MSRLLSTIIFALAIITGAYLLGTSYVERSRPEGTISVTGLGETNFNSDLIVWEGSFVSENYDLQKAFEQLQQSKALIEGYLRQKGVAANEIVFKAVNTQQKTKALYGSNGNYQGDQFDGFRLTQAVQIESGEIDKIEALSREITELLNQGVPFYSKAPRYYYTQLADLKIELISKASEDARIRAEQIATNSGTKLGELRDARMGVFQITGQNADEDYSWGGTFNTSSRNKTASITVKANYKAN